MEQYKRPHPGHSFREQFCSFLGSIILLATVLPANALPATFNEVLKQSPTGDRATAVIKEEVNVPEYRFLWVTRYQLRSTADIALVVERARKYNFNALFVQVYALGEAYYHSKICPWGKGVTPDLDPLREVIRLARPLGIEVHAWLNTAFVWGDAKNPPQDPGHVLRKHPDWLVKDKHNKTILDYPAWERQWLRISGLYLDLGKPQVREYCRELFLEVAGNYPVDGLHFDYVRYPGEQFGFDQALADKFKEKYQIDPYALVLNKGIALKVFGKERYQALLSAWDDLRRQQVEELVADVYRQAKGSSPNIKISAAVVADLDMARRHYFQDWGAWLKDGVVDLVVPMSYAESNELVQRQTAAAAQLAQDSGRAVVVGLGAWKQTPEQVAGKVSFIRKLRGAMGFSCLQGVSLFSYDELIKNSDYLPKLQQQVFQNKAAIP